MIRRIPQNHRWTGPYLGNYYGTLWKTFNVDLDRNEGKVSLSHRVELIEDSTELTDLGAGDCCTIATFLRTDADCTDRYWAANQVSLFKTDSAATPLPSNDWDTDGLSSSPTSGINDMTVHGNDSRNDSGRNKLIVTTDSDIAVLNDTGNNAWTGSWWVTKHSQPGLNSSVFHPIEYFPFRKITLVGDGNLVHTISRPSDTQNDTVSYARLVLPRDLVVKHIFTTATRAWLCCYNRKAETGAVVEWDGFSQSANALHNIYGMAALSGVNYTEIPIVVNNRGMILEYSGNGFIPMVRNGQKIGLPILDEPGNSMTSNAFSGGNNFFLWGRGMTVSEDGLVYLALHSPIVRSFRQGGGIWCLNPEVGRLYNKYSLGNANDSSDYGQQFPSTPKALYSVSSDLTNSNRGLLIGGNVGITASTFAQGIWLLKAPTDTTHNRGYFITQYIPADEVREFWDALWVRFKSFVTSSSRIVVKARGVRPLTTSSGAPLQDTITWTGTTTFTVTLSASDDALAVGDEVEIIRGPNAGYLAHITTISGAHAALQTITIDETVVSSTATATARFDRWKKIGTVTSTSVYEQKMNIGIDSSFIQFKVEMRGPAREMEVSDLTVVSKSSIQLEN